MNSQLNVSHAIPLHQDNIPSMLKGVDRWVPWKKGQTKPNGKFDKVPVDPHTGKNMNGNDPKNWMGFDAACAAYDQGQSDGIGIVLSGDPITYVDEVPLYLIALDFDGCTPETTKGLKQLRNALGGIYGEVSPSGKGIRMLALSRTLLKGGNTGEGREMYATGRFVTITGISGKGWLIDATEPLKKLHDAWFPLKAKHTSLASLSLTEQLANPPKPETPEAIEKVKSMLAFIPADCPYDQWRDVTWSVLSTGWEAAEEIARQWSTSAPDRYDEVAFDSLVNSFDPGRGISVGTLHHYAKLHGWKQPTTEQPVMAINTPITTRRLLTASDLRSLPPYQSLIKGILPRNGLATIYGPSASGKTFVALDIACSVATAQPDWFGGKVRRAPVAYVALEGEAGIRQRVAAWEAHNNISLDGTIRFVLGNFSLLDTLQAATLAEEILQALGKGSVIFIDTLSQAAPGADENASTDMSRLIGNAKLIASTLEGLVILVHHAGKDASRGMRGHSSLFAAMDGVIEVKADSSGRSWSVAKNKEGVQGIQNHFELAPVPVGQDEDGDAITSCAVRRVIGVPVQTKGKLTGKNQTRVMGALREMAQTYPSGVPLEKAIEGVSSVLDAPPGRRKTIATDTIRSLVDKGYLDETGGTLSIS